MAGVSRFASLIDSFIKNHTKLLSYENLEKYITEVKDFPKEGIIFKDIDPIYKDPKLWKELMLPLEHII
tara:strand:- start:295 stop:501 length:207 start_codon:yes stop_codon:yes gene_type:complete